MTRLAVIAGLVVFLIGMAAAALGHYDVLRYLVLAQIGIVLFLDLRAFIDTVRRAERDPDPTTHELRVGRACGQAGVAILLGVGAEGVIARIGHPDLNPLTPVVQLALLLLFVAWDFVERKRFISTAAELIEVAVEERERNGG